MTETLEPGLPSAPPGKSGSGSGIQDEARRWLCKVAAAGELADIAANRPAALPRLRSAAYELTWPLVWSVHTRPLENRKGHHACARAVTSLADGCLDGFHDDVEAVVHHLLTYGKQEITNLEGWVTSRIGAATVDGYRRRRGRLGAQQRPRVPGWLATALGDDPWLVELARSVIEWVGVRSTAGPALWPVDSWAELRERIVPERGPARLAEVAGDVEHVLASMRACRPRWYALYIETPLGRKEPPVAVSALDDASLPPLPLADEHDRGEAALSGLADAAVQAIQAGLTAGGEPRHVVQRVLSTLFLGPDTSGCEIADVPMARAPLDDHVSAVLAGNDDITGLVEAVLAIVTNSGVDGGDAAPVLRTQG